MALKEFINNTTIGGVAILKGGEAFSVVGLGIGF